jgi:hypothetical protein
MGTGMREINEYGLSEGNLFGNDHLKTNKEMRGNKKNVKETSSEDVR